MNPALFIIFGTILFAALLGIFAGRRVPMNLENWTVGGRRFGVLLIWLLMAGEIYTTFTFLGASGWAYSKGAPAFYILIYGTLAYTLSFFILPALWRVGKKHSLHTQPDFFIQRYGSRALGVFVALVGVASIIPYLELQLSGLGYIVNIASRGAISAPLAILISFVLTCAFVLTSGIRGAAWVAVVKDIMMLLAVAVVGIGVPLIYFGGVGKMFRAISLKFPGHLVFPGAAPHMDVVWVMSTCLLTGLGFYMWPHMFGAAFSAKSAETIKRNAIIMPFYQIPTLLVFLVGFTALLVIPGLAKPDTSFMALADKTYPSWFVGFIGAAGAVTAMVPSAVLVLFAATLLAKNVYQTGFNPRASEDKVLRLSRITVVVIMFAALVLALYFPDELVNLLIFGYDGVSQFFPGVVLGLFWKRAHKLAVAVGLAAGVGTVVALIVTKNDPFFGLNAGFVGLAVNTLLVLILSWGRAQPSH
ncbi:MAG: sodium:solute symporter [Candidatus Aminicenantes bacterium RBG_13_63_10]|nr:MAG: sodium:solute symporter [Candidatus Aminicenantes bacterium RBG_13_63_10]